MTETRSRTLIVFARNPVPGRVKTRLIPALGAEAATRLYTTMLERTLNTATALGIDLALCCDELGAACAHYANKAGATLQRQQGSDLGERMQHAFDRELQTTSHAVLIGTDCPGITTDYIESAFTALQSHDAVIGPAMDGGYVLIGLNQPRQALFKAIDWGTNAVLDQTRERYHQLSLKVFELEARHDIDTADDLLHYPEYHARFLTNRLTKPC